MKMFIREAHPCYSCGKIILVKQNIHRPPYEKLFCSDKCKLISILADVVVRELKREGCLVKKNNTTRSKKNKDNNGETNGANRLVQETD